MFNDAGAPSFGGANKHYFVSSVVVQAAPPRVGAVGGNRGVRVGEGEGARGAVGEEGLPLGAALAVVCGSPDDGWGGACFVDEAVDGGGGGEV